jgi:hypothetical protein
MLEDQCLLLKEEADDAMSWLRNNDQLDDVDFGLPRRLETCWCEMPACRYCLEGKTRVMDEAMNWLRNNEVKPGDVDVGRCFEH